MNTAETIAAETGFSGRAVAGVISLLDDGATVPFIARYRKERTGGMDEDVIRAVRDRLAALRELDRRREAILESLRERELLTDELARAIAAASSRAELEDIYLPYRPKRRTRAQVAREAGLGALADFLEWGDDDALRRAIGSSGGGRPDSASTVDAAALIELAAVFVNEESGVTSAEAALAGARDILAERISESAEVRSALRGLFAQRAQLQSKRARGSRRAAGSGSRSRASDDTAPVSRGAADAGKPAADPADIYRDYFDHSEAAARAPSHRVLAILRGEREGHLSVHVLPEEERALDTIERQWVRERLMPWASAGGGGRSDGGGDSGTDPGAGTAADRARDNRRGAEAGTAGAADRGGPARGNSRCQAPSTPERAGGPLAVARRDQLEQAAAEAWKRLLAPSLENERKGELERVAQQEAAEVFAKNVRELLLAAPMGSRRLLAVDPGHRTGCKIVCLDEHGELAHHEAIYPLAPQRREREAADRLRALCGEHRIEAIAVGNGTGGREAHAFARGLELKRADGSPMPVVTVNEAGASVYSASAVAKEELPDHDVTVRGAVSIGRRLIDPLAELVKIDPQSIGVGQYQHDVDDKLLALRLADTVVSCVNAVGVDVNTASPHLLQHVSGLTAKSARAIVEKRRAAGRFRSRAELTGVPGLGPKRFELAAGFLRVRGENPLDATAIHPERYRLVERMARDLGASVAELVGNEALCRTINLKKYQSDDVGMATLTDIISELTRPGRDPRPEWDPVEFREDITEIGDLREGMKLAGVVTNITGFGAFVDIGVHRDGLVHISKLADRYVADPHEVVSVGARVEVTVTGVDLERGRISLSMVG